MSRKPGNISRIFTNLKNSFFVAKQNNKYIGSDQFGNEYYEIIGGKFIQNVAINTVHLKNKLILTSVAKKCPSSF